MPQDPNAAFDHTVLEMIEHSPTGAVPHTPAYQDALNRLRHSHQVYSSADYKDGYVTVRSLSQLPLFYANNLDEVISGAVDVTALEPDASIFTRYVQSLPAALRPKAEAARAALVARRAHHRSKHAEAVHEPVHTLFLIPGSGPHPGLAGNYLYGSLHEIKGAWEVYVHDSDDGLAVFETPSQAEAFSKLQEALASAPCLLSELEIVGFRLK